MKADRALVNGHILTMDDEMHTAEAIAMRAGRIVCVGNGEECLATVGKSADVIDLQGAYVIPGLVDPHLHLATDTAGGDKVELRDFFDDAVRSVADIAKRLERRSASAGVGEWIVGIASPMQAARLAERRLPKREELDAAVGDRPCYVTFGAHITVANSAALRARSVDSRTEDPPGGIIERDDATGEPTGVLHERARLLMTGDGASSWDEEGHIRAAVREIDRCLSRGVTSIHDILRFRREMRLYQRLRSLDQLRCRVQVVPRVIEAEFGRDCFIDAGISPGFGDDFLRFGGVKISIDGGVTGGHGAFAPEPDGAYPLDSVIRIEQAELDAVVEAHHRAGIRVCVHAIGDMALDMALEAFRRAYKSCTRQLRHRIEHMGNWLCTPERVSDAVEYGLTAVANPSFLHYLGEEILDSLGPRRLSNAFPFRTVSEAGIRLVFGSDGPAYWPSDPLRDIGAAMTQRSRRGLVYSPEQRITAVQGIWAQTRNAAWLGMVEHDLGSLEVGKLGDMVVLADSPLQVDAERFGAIPVVATLVDGEIVFGEEAVRSL